MSLRLRRAFTVCLSVSALLVGAPSASAAGLEWEEALLRAEESREGIVVDVGAPWCHACNVLETRTLDDPRVRSALRDDWILVQVDVDRRPDLHRLFHARGHDGLPTLHFLDSAGRELLRTGPLDPEEMVETLDHLRSGRPPGISLLDGGIAATPISRSAIAILESAQARFLGELDTERGGFGRGAKYLSSMETDFLLELARGDPEEFAPALDRFVSAVLESPLHDRVEGGFHRYSETPDWTVPHWEKLLEVQAVMLEALLLDAELHPENEDRNRAAAAGTIAFLGTRLLDPETELFFASVNADVLSSGYGGILETGDDYYSRPGRARVVSGRGPDGSPDSGIGAAGRNGTAPSVDRTLLTASNARVAAALIEAGRAWRKRAWIKMGERVRRAIPRVLVDEEKRLLRWKSQNSEGPALVEDWTEWGFLLLTTDEPDDRSRAADAVRTIRERFVGETGRLLSRPVGAPVIGESVDPGGDGARTILFLARYALETGDGETTFLALDLLDSLASASPRPAFAELGLAAYQLARE